MASKRTKTIPKAELKPRLSRRPRLYETPEWPEMRQAALAYAAGGQYLDESCIAAGFSEAVWHKYQAMTIEVLEAAREKAKAKGHDQYWRYIPKRDREYVNFVEAMWKAKAQAKTIAATEFRKKDPGEYLARIDHEKWGRKDRMTLTGADGGPIEVREVRRVVVDS